MLLGFSVLIKMFHLLKHSLSADIIFVACTSELSIDEKRDTTLKVGSLKHKTGFVSA